MPTLRKYAIKRYSTRSVQRLPHGNSGTILIDLLPTLIRSPGPVLLQGTLSKPSFLNIYLLAFLSNHLAANDGPCICPAHFHSTVFQSIILSIASALHTYLGNAMSTASNIVHDVP